MNKLEEKLNILIQVLIYSFAAFGVAMFIGYLLCILMPERNYIPMMAILQTLIYIGGVAFAILVTLTDFISDRIPEKIRIVSFFTLIYVMGIIFFQFNAPNRPFDEAKYFFEFSIWVVWISAMALGVWLLYQCFLNRKYNNCLIKYQNKLEKDE